MERRLSLNEDWAGFQDLQTMNACPVALYALRLHLELASRRSSEYRLWPERLRLEREITLVKNNLQVNQNLN